jgi:diadenylate cyclase
MALGRLFNLVLLNWILKNLMTALIVAIPIVFQPELRTALEKLGRTKFLGDLSFAKKDSGQVIDEIISAVYMFSKQKIGALIVLKRQTGLKEYVDNGIEVDATVSAELLSSMFFPKSPLHDGAAIIAGDKIISAGSTLPISMANLSSNFGTRHKAALGITEDSDAIAVVVSEETGGISMAVGGKLETKISEERLKNRLMSLMRQGNKK